MKAIRSGNVDAVVVDGPLGNRIFTLQSPEEPYRILAERMNEGAATLTQEGTIIFCNPRLAEMVGLPGRTTAGLLLFFRAVPRGPAGLPRVGAAGARKGQAHGDASAAE